MNMTAPTSLRTGQSAAQNGCSAAKVPGGILDENVGLAESLLLRLARIDLRLQDRLDRFFGGEPRDRGGDTDASGYGPGVLQNLVGRQHLQAHLVGQIEDKLEKLENL